MNLKRYGGTDLLWKDRKRFLGLPLSFTRYLLVKREGVWMKMFSNIGFLYSVIEEVNLYRICDISFRQSLMGKLLNTGTIELKSNDATRPVFYLKNIKNPFQVREMISTLVEEQRKIHGVRLAEFHSHE